MGCRLFRSQAPSTSPSTDVEDVPVFWVRAAQMWQEAEQAAARAQQAKAN